LKLNKILCLIPTFKEKPSKTVESLENQSQVETEIVVVGAYPSSEIDGVKFVLSTPNMRESVGIRVARALNHALGRVNIIDFDYVAKFDDDVILPNALPIREHS
jgi:hypothetical protein